MLIWTGVSCDGGETRLVVISYIEAGVVRGPLSRLCHYSVTGQTRDTVEGPTGHHWLPLCPTLTLSILISLSHAKIKALAGLAGDWGCVWCAARDGERHSGNLLRSRGHVLVTQSQVTHSQVTLKWLSSDSGHCSEGSHRSLPPCPLSVAGGSSQTSIQQNSRGKHIKLTNLFSLIAAGSSDHRGEL